MALHKNLQGLLILEFSNEPVSHFAKKQVKYTLKAIPDKLHRECKVGDELHYPYLDQSAYQASVLERDHLDVSPPINIDTVVVDDGDDIIL